MQRRKYMTYVWDEEKGQMVFRFVETLDNEKIHELLGDERNQAPYSGVERMMR